jgi:mycothiol synthase
MTVEYRLAEYGDFDVEAVVAIALSIRPDAFESVARYTEWIDAQRSVGRLCLHWVASVDGYVVGSAYVDQSSSLPQDVVAIYVAIDPDHQRMGYGRALLERAAATASERGGERIYSWSDETRPRSLRFLASAGFVEIERGWASTLDLTHCDRAGLQDRVDNVVAGGIRVVSATALAAERKSWKRDLHRLYAEIETDIPAPFPIQKMPFSDFERLNLSSRFVGDGFFVALDGERLVGLTEPQYVHGNASQISQNLTAVRPEYRGRGIASAIKSQAALWAIESGYTSIRTHNAQSNIAMLAVNDSLGFTRSHATVGYLKDPSVKGPVSLG